MISLRQIHLRHLHLPAWLGIAAIMMLFIAPMISKSLANEGVTQHMMMSGMMMSDRDMPDHQEVSEPCQNQVCKSVPHNVVKGMLTGDMSDAACGYCVLLVHFPVLDLQALPMLWSLNVSSRAPPAAVIQRLILPLLFTDSQPRAPPGF